MCKSKNPFETLASRRGKSLEKNILHILPENKRKVKYEKNDLRQMCEKIPVQRDRSVARDGLQGL